jgi:hypothetical protein
MRLKNLAVFGALSVATMISTDTAYGSGVLIPWRDVNRDIGEYDVCRSVSKHCPDSLGKIYLNFECPNHLKWVATVHHQPHQGFTSNIYFLIFIEEDVLDEGPFDLWKTLLERVEVLEKECPPPQIS